MEGINQVKAACKCRSVGERKFGLASRTSLEALECFLSSFSVSEVAEEEEMLYCNVTAALILILSKTSPSSSCRDRPPQSSPSRHGSWQALPRASKKFPDLPNGAEIMGFLCSRASVRARATSGGITPPGHPFHRLEETLVAEEPARQNFFISRGRVTVAYM